MRISASLILSVFIYAALCGSCPAETVTIAHFLPEDSGVLLSLKAGTSKYSELHPDVTFAFEEWDMASYGEELLGRLQTGKPCPDLIQCFSFWAKNAGGRAGLIMRLTAYLDRENPYGRGMPWVEHFNGELLDDMRDQIYGDIWATPFGAATVRIYANEALLAACDQSVPKTFGQFIAVQKRLKEKGHVPCVMIGTPPPGPSDWAFRALTTMVLQSKADAWDLMNGDGRIDRFEMAVALHSGALSLDDPELLEGLRLLHTWARLWQENHHETNAEDALEAFSAGNVGFYMDSMTRWQEIKQSVKAGGGFPVAVFPFPKLSEQDSEYYDGAYYEPLSSAGLNICIPAVIEGSDKERLKRAVDVLAFLTSPAGQSVITQSGCLLPAVRGVKVPNELDGFRPRIVGAHPLPHPFLLTNENRTIWIDQGLEQKILSEAWDPEKIRKLLAPAFEATSRSILRNEIQALQKQMAYHRGAYALLELKMRLAREQKNQPLIQVMDQTMRNTWSKLEHKQDLLIFLNRALRDQ